MPDDFLPPARAWQRMLSGRRLDLLEPSALDIEIADIAHGLARVARWNGQTIGEHAYSVAQHSLAVLAIFDHFWPAAPAAHRLCVVLHDAPEYVIGDMISPFKAVLGGAYKQVEARLQAAIHLRFGLPAETPAALKTRIKRADHISAYFEATLLAGFDEAEAVRFFKRPHQIDSSIHPYQPWPVQLAQQRFLQAFAALDRDFKKDRP
jgi:uncharacterized protein